MPLPYGGTERAVLVEVKPATKPAQLRAPYGRIVGTGWRSHWLCVGIDPSITTCGRGPMVYGRAVDAFGDPEAWAKACNITQWKAPTNALDATIAKVLRQAPKNTQPRCEACGAQDHLLHKRVCPGK
jgi:hypothetical protein